MWTAVYLRSLRPLARVDRAAISNLATDMDGQTTSRSRLLFAQARVSKEKSHSANKKDSERVKKREREKERQKLASVRE